MLLVLRTYDFSPGFALEYLEIFSRENLPLITRYLPLVGCCVTEVGVLSQVRHAWIYSDFADRTERRTKLVSDKDWTEGFLSRGMALISRQEPSFLRTAG